MFRSIQPVVMKITIMPVKGLPLIHAGDDLPALIAELVGLEKGDIVSIASSVYSKSKGYTRQLDDITPTARAERISKMTGEDPRFLQSILDASKDVILEYPFILSEVNGGHVGVRAGVDQSNIEDGMVILLPPDPMKAADEVRAALKKITGKDIGVIITDTCGRAFRRGQTGNAIGWSGMVAIRDFRGDKDLFGHVLKITEEAVVDELAGIANFVMGESNNGVPAVVIRGCERWAGHHSLYFTQKEDFIRKALTEKPAKKKR
jgi:coenzyme F420-0:L-glutamate ligase/coenzyme F420-1:gamma-L-glutamate ligase